MNKSSAVSSTASVTKWSVFFQRMWSYFSSTDLCFPLLYARIITLPYIRCNTPLHLGLTKQSSMSIDASAWKTPNAKPKRNLNWLQNEKAANLGCFFMLVLSQAGLTYRAPFDPERGIIYILAAIFSLDVRPLRFCTRSSRAGINADRKSVV